MNVFDMKKEDFEKVPKRGGWLRDVGKFNALVIIPQSYANGSSWMMNRNLRYICPESGMFPNGENDFCSYGERKGGDNND